MICSKEKCTGCFGCYNICPKKAIEMKKDEYGNIYSHINKEKCINCGLCKKVCPQLKNELDFKEPITAFAMYIKDKDKRSQSTSGGAATVFYEYTLSKKGIVYGVSNFGAKEKLSFIRIDNIKDLYKVKGSKYVHCYVNDAFSQIKKDLTEEKEVLFIGTPCQVSGLKLFLMKDYDNLTTVDIICHGVPSQQLLFDELKKLTIDSSMVESISFRDGNGYNLKVVSMEGNILYENNSMNNDYYRNFLSGNFYRENCYSCRYARRERISDITIGDFWGLSKDSKIYDDEKKGISVILPNTEKGLKLVESIKSKCNIEERKVDEACKENGQLNHPMKKTKAYSIYLENYPKLGYKKTVSKMTNIKTKIKIMARNNKLIYSIYKKIKG